MTRSPHQPNDYPTVSVYMMANGAQRVIDFVAHVFGGEAVMRLDREDGSVMHAAVRIGDSVVMLSGGTAQAAAFPFGSTSMCPTWMQPTAEPWSLGLVRIRFRANKATVTDTAGSGTRLGTHGGQQPT